MVPHTEPQEQVTRRKRSDIMGISWTLPCPNTARHHFSLHYKVKGKLSPSYLL